VATFKSRNAQSDPRLAEQPVTKLIG
jgi:hypothetical protein